MGFEEIHTGALLLPEDKRAELAAELLCSLPATLADPDGGIAEANRRLTELKNDPLQGCSWEEIKSGLGR